MAQWISKFRVIFICFLFCSLIWSGCIHRERHIKNRLEIHESLQHQDTAYILPDWENGSYHDYDAMLSLLKEWEINHPDVVTVFSIGSSVNGKDIMCIQLTNQHNDSKKYSAVIDGCIHGNEWESGEACLYLADFLLRNYQSNNSIASILNISKLYIVPHLNPDGRQTDDRFNARGIDLNRNFNVHFGRILGGSLPLGTVFGKTISVVRRPVLIEKFGGTRLFKTSFWTNSGRKPFSEPETDALRSLLNTVENDLSFYVNCHTAMHIIFPPATISFRPEYHITDRQHAVLQAVMNWCDDHTRYDTGSSTHEVMFGGGLAHHWVFKRYYVPSFCFEILSRDYEPSTGHGKHDRLVPWMKTTLPFFLYLLVNIELLAQWQKPDHQPFLPELLSPSYLTDV